MSEISSLQFEIELLNFQYSQSNYKIVRRSNKKNTIVVLFSSNAIYYPNDNETFKYVIVDNDRYEWTRTDFYNADCVLFVRDVYKQWYVTGISSTVSDFDKLKLFLEKMIEGFENIYFVGISAGGYIAILMSLLLEGKVSCYAFSPQIELYSQMDTINGKLKNKILFEKLTSKKNMYFNLVEYFSSSDWSKINLIFPLKSCDDKKQIDLIERSSINPNKLYLNYNRHGLVLIPECIPMLIDKFRNVNDIKFKNRWLVIISILGTNGFLKIFIPMLYKKLMKRLKKYI
ncbi:TPA: hypothetical protein PMC85_003427 [Vibrio cholerae]|nr:hypothetical protein [Vibrio cholerae]